MTPSSFSAHFLHDMGIDQKQLGRNWMLLYVPNHPESISPHFSDMCYTSYNMQSFPRFGGTHQVSDRCCFYLGVCPEIGKSPKFIAYDSYDII